MNKLSRFCPECDDIIYYKYKSSLIRAIKNNTFCSSCKQIGSRNNMKKDDVKEKITGKNNGMYNRSHYDIWLEKYGTKEADKRRKELNNKLKKNHANINGKYNPRYGKSNYDIWLEKYGKEEADKRKRVANEKNSKSNSGKNHPLYGKKRTTEYRKKMRLIRLNDIKEKNGIIFPNYNPSTIPIIESVAEKMGITDLMHAENGGEFYIKELGYWVDGYSKNKNIVIEYYEPFHQNQIERDERRKQEIIKYLNCKFIEIKE